MQFPLWQHTQALGQRCRHCCKRVGVFLLGTSGGAQHSVTFSLPSTPRRWSFRVIRSKDQVADWTSCLNGRVHGCRSAALLALQMMTTPARPYTLSRAAPWPGSTSDPARGTSRVLVGATGTVLQHACSEMNAARARLVTQREPSLRADESPLGRAPKPVCIQVWYWAHLCPLSVTSEHYLLWTLVASQAGLVYQLHRQVPGLWP